VIYNGTSLTMYLNGSQIASTSWVCNDPMYIELGFEFFAANGDYYLHMSKKHGTFDNDNFKLPYGIGFLFPF